MHCTIQYYSDLVQLHFLCKWGLCMSIIVTLYEVSIHSKPMAVEVIQLLLDGTAEAPSVVPVEPLAHDTHSIVTLFVVKSKVLNLGSDATTTSRMTFFLHCCWCAGCPRYILTGSGGGGERKDQIGFKARKKT